MRPGLSPDLLDLTAQPGGSGFARLGIGRGDSSGRFLGALLGFGDPLLRRLGVGLDLGEPLLGGGDRLGLGVSLSLQLVLMAGAQLVEGLGAAGALFLEVGLQGFDLGRRTALGRGGDVGGGGQLAFRCLDLRAELLSARLAWFLTHWLPNLLPRTPR